IQTIVHRRSSIVRTASSHLLLLAIGLFFALPFYWLVSTALKTDAQVFKMPPIWIPDPPKWDNYGKALTYIPFAQYTWNTLKICSLNVIGTLLSCSLVAYSLAKIRWPGRDIVFFVLLATLILPAQVTLIPTFTIFKALGWIGTILPLVAP